MHLVQILIPLTDGDGTAFTREEFALLVQTGQSEGEFDESQAQFITKTLRFDTLDAEDVMIHRLDIQWLDVNTPKEELPRLIARIRHSRVPVCDGDVASPSGDAAGDSPPDAGAEAAGGADDGVPALGVVALPHAPATIRIVAAPAASLRARPPRWNRIR